MNRQMNRHKFKCNFIKKINAVCCHLLHIAPLLPRITNNKFASPIVKNWHECHKHTNIVNTAGMVEYNRLQIGATPDYELFKKSIANFLALIFEAFFCKVPSQLKWIKGYSVIQSKVSLFLLDLMYSFSSSRFTLSKTTQSKESDTILEYIF